MSTAAERVVIVGGGIVGSSIAWWLRTLNFAGEVIVVEKDSTYVKSSTALSAAAIRTQFACPVNVRMSLFGAHFLRNIKAHFGPEADIGFHEKGYLILGGEGTAAAREAARKMQCAEGAKITALDAAALARRFTWINTDGIETGTLGERDEGWFDAWSLLSLFRRGARALGATYLDAEVTGPVVRGGRIRGVELTNGNVLPADWCVNAAGAQSAKLTRNIGIDIPVRPRKRSVFSFSAPLQANDFPMLFDPTGAWVRPEGEGFIGGIAPPASNDPDADGDFEPHHELVEQEFW